MSPLIRYYPGDRCLDFLLVVTLGVALASSAAWLVSRRLADNAALRHLVLFSALICCLASPAAAWFCAATGLTLVSIPFLNEEQGGTTAGVARMETDPVWAPPRQSAAPSPAAGPPLPDAKIDQSAGVAAPSSANQSPETLMACAPVDRPSSGAAGTLPSFRGIAAVLMFVWAAGALLMLARLARNCGAVMRLRRSSSPSRNEAHKSLIQEIAAELGIRPVPLLLMSRRAVAPLAVGFGRPAILLPERLLGVLSVDELRDILMHEAAHLQRGDQRIVLLQELAGALYWPIVSVHALNRELQRSREEVCDNAVLVGRDAISYGKTLLHVAELLAKARPMSAAVGVVGGRGELEQRIVRLLNPRRNAMTVISYKVSHLILSLFLAVGALLSATRFAASSESDRPQPPAKPPAVTSAAGTTPSDAEQADKAPSKKEASEVKARATETVSRSYGWRHPHEFTSNDGFEDVLIGGLVESNWWSKLLPLAPAQASAIKKLDALVRDAGDNVMLVGADYLDTDPPDFQEFVARVNKRLLKTRKHGERMVSLGLLTEPQAASVMQRYLSGDNHLYVLYDENVRDLLGMTASQEKELVKVGEAANHREALLNLWSVKPAEQEYVRTVMTANAKRMNEEALEVLTPDQRKLWDQLAAARSLPVKPPELAAPSEAEAAGIKLNEVSPVFHLLTEKADAFRLSDAQKKLLTRLEEITREGLYWISLRNSKDAAASTAFVKQAEQVALFGVLTEKQAEQVTNRKSHE